MARTAPKSKNRLDFSSALNEAIPKIDPSSEEQSNEPAIGKIESRTETVNVNPASSPSDQVLPAPQQPQATKISKSLYAYATMQKKHGIAKSIYLEKDVHDYIASQVTLTNLTFSQVVNLLLKKIMIDDTE